MNCIWNTDFFIEIIDNIFHVGVICIFQANLQEWIKYLEIWWSLSVTKYNINILNESALNGFVYQLKKKKLRFDF